MRPMFAVGLGLVALGGLAACDQLLPAGGPGLPGPALYAENCASCHGDDAKGGRDGTGKSAPDLTTLSARHGGSYPAAWVMSTIDGYAREATHGPMPIFGTLLEGPVEVWIDEQGTPTPTPASLIVLSEYLEDRQGD